VTGEVMSLGQDPTEALAKRNLQVLLVPHLVRPFNA
jgi:hypothetical protein